MDGQVVDRPEASRFELVLEGGTAFANYRLSGDRVILTHTEVPQALSGQGVGSRLARGVFDQIRASGRKAVPLCDFLGAWAAKHHEYNDVIDG